MSVSFFDTNVLVYTVDVDEPDKQSIARALLTGTMAAGQAVISTQILQEFYWAITRKLPRRFDAVQAEQAVRDLTRLPVVQVDGSMTDGRSKARPMHVSRAHLACTRPFGPHPQPLPPGARGLMPQVAAFGTRRVHPAG